MILNIKVQIFIILIFINFVHCDRVLFNQCTERIATAKNVQIEINNCNTSRICTLSRGENVELIVKFTPSKDSSAEFERLIIAQIPSKNKLIEIPYYGETMDIINSTFFEQDNQPFVYPIRKNIPLVHRFIFPVLKESPSVSLIIRYIIREKIDNIIMNQRNWQSHSGALFVCVNINAEIV